ncbi:MAG TPA: hypothetical protein VMM78_10255 [Thermomicrobiales bacterium]|nr:hypothetical protein [Thermomicrobiales bacterium]
MAATDNREQKCYYHPNVTTLLRCSRCDKPICPRCMVSSPVGYRCPDCARGPRPAIYQTTAAGMALAIAVGSLAAVGTGLLWGRFPEWQFYCALLLGFSVSESMSWAVKYKRGRELQVAAWACVFLGLVVSRLAMAWFSEMLTVDMLLNELDQPGVAQAFQLRLLPDVLFMGIPFLINYIRFR